MLGWLNERVEVVDYEEQKCVQNAGWKDVQKETM